MGRSRADLKLVGPTTSHPDTNGERFWVELFIDVELYIYILDLFSLIRNYLELRVPNVLSHFHIFTKYQKMNHPMPTQNFGVKRETRSQK